MVLAVGYGWVVALEAQGKTELQVVGQGRVIIAKQAFSPHVGPYRCRYGYSCPPIIRDPGLPDSGIYVTVNPCNQ